MGEENFHWVWRHLILGDDEVSLELNHLIHGLDIPWMWWEVLSKGGYIYTRLFVMDYDDTNRNSIKIWWRTVKKK